MIENKENKGIEFLEKLSKLMNEYNGSIELCLYNYGNTVEPDIDVEIIIIGENPYSFSFESKIIDKDEINSKIKEIESERLTQ